MKIRFLLLSALLAGTSQGVPAQEKRVLTLETCKELALKNNADIQTGRMDVEAASQTRKEAFTKYFPKYRQGLSRIRLTIIWLKEPYRLYRLWDWKLRRKSVCWKREIW